MRYLMKIAYVGTGFCGFQVQPNKRTVQGELNRAAKEIFGCECAITGCSRTDSGVHAKEFFCTLDVQKETALSQNKLPLAFASHLPNDVSVLSCAAVEETFHPRYDAIGKEYVYLIDNSPTGDPFLLHRAWHFPRPLNEDAVNRMQEAASYLIGKHDFASFAAQGFSSSTTVRTITKCECTKVGTNLRIMVAGDGFLYNMVRIIVGTLIDVGEGRLESKDIPAVLDKKDRAAAGMTAPPDGLYLFHVFYPKDKLSQDI